MTRLLLVVALLAALLRNVVPHLLGDADALAAFVLPVALAALATAVVLLVQSIVLSRHRGSR